MKKLLFLLMVVFVPVLLMAQPMDYVTIYDENFDGEIISIPPYGTPDFGGDAGDWRVVGTGITYENWGNYLPLYKSPTRSYHSPVYSTSGNSQFTTPAIPLTTPGLDVNYVYFDFDHICKVNQLDAANIYYAVSQGQDDEGNIIWSSWKKLTFNNSSSFYYGEAASPTASTINSGKFSDKAYANWNSSDIYAVPDNTWWHHEMFDLTSIINNEGNPTHIQFQFRLNKQSGGSTGTDNCAGWYVDNLEVRLSNCELIKPKITMKPPFYYNEDNNFTNVVGPYPIKATLYDNDTINLNSILFWYSINNGDTVHVSNNGAFSGVVLNAEGHTIQAQWELPIICYQDTIHYHIYLEDTHGSSSRFDTFLIAHHNYPTIHYNDVRLDSVNTMPHCLISNQAQPITVYFTNRSDAEHSPGSNYMVSASFVIEVRDEQGQLYHNETFNWTDEICFDVPSSLSLGSFLPHQGYNYVTVYVTTRNGQLDGYHGNDTIKKSPYACDSLLNGDYTIGGTNPDFADLAAAKTQLEYCGLGGPVRFHLRPGTYSGFTFEENYIGQSEVNTITFQGDDVNTVILTNNSTDAGANVFGAVTLVNVKNYIFKNLTIQGKNEATASRGVFVRGNGSTNILFDGCKITAHNTHSTAATSSAVSRTTAATTYPDTITFRNCTITGGNFGINYVGAAQKRNHLVIDSCDITSCYRGIYTNYSTGNILHNHIKQVSSTNPQNFSGIHVNYLYGGSIDGNTVDSVTKLEYGIYVTNATTEDYHICNNHLKVGNGLVGLYVTNSHSTNTMTGYIYNNEIILYPVTANNSYAMQINSCNNLQVINNSLLVKSGAPYSNTAALYIANNNNTNIYNNIFINLVANNDNTDYPLYLNANSTVTGSYDVFYSGSGVVAYKTVPRNTIEELIFAVPTLSDLTFMLPPMEDNTQSLLPTSFNGLECWRNENVLKDIRNLNRSEVTYMGAYADVIPSTDAALTALVSPMSGACPQPVYDITVEITNKGAQTINFATTPATVLLQSTAMNLNQTITVNTGSVTALNSIEKVLLSNVTVPVNQPVDFRIAITTPGDNNHVNDTLVQTFVLEAIVPDYSEDFSNGTQQTWTIQQVSGAGNWSFQNGEGSNPTIMPNYGTGRLFFNSKNFASGTTSRAILPVVTLYTAFNPILEIRFAHDNAATSKNDEMTVKISTDNGITYTNLICEETNTATLKRYKNVSTPEWDLYTFDLSSYMSAGCVYIAFEATSKGGNNINIDRIRVRNRHSNDVAVTKIYGAGETPTEYEMRDVVSALVKNEGALPQSNVKVYLNVTGASEQWHDSVTIASLPYHGEAIVTFPDHQYNVAEVKDVEVRAANDDFNDNNAMHWRMVTTPNAATIADTTTDIVLLGDYNNIIRPCVRYKTNEDLAVTAVKYYYDQTYISDPENGFRAFVADASGNILATSQVVHFNTLQQHQWNIIPIYNFALTNTTGEFYVGLEMLSHGNYLCAQVETPLRDSTFYYLTNDGTYVPQLTGRFMFGALVDTPYVNDVALLNLVHPVSDCDLGHEHLKVRITNNGTTDIVPPIQLHYTINGGATVSENFTDTLHSHEITIFTFNSIYDFTNNQIGQDDNYAVKVWATKLAQDRLTENDTLSLTVVSMGKSNLPIVEDTVIVNYHTATTLTAQLPASIPEGVLAWYTNTGFESWNLLGYGPSYTTPLIYFDTTYYVTANPGTLDDVIVGTGTTGGTDPINFNDAYSRGRTLYLYGTDIPSHGRITELAFYVNTPVPEEGSQGIPMRIYMKCTDENLFTSTDVNWEDEISNATLVVDERVFFDHSGWFYFNMQTPFDFNSGNLVIYTETTCGDVCTGTGNQCYNCGQYVSGAAVNSLKFNTSGAPNNSNQYCQKKSAHTVAGLSGAFGGVNKRINTRFSVSNLDCGSVKVPIRLHVPDIPDYDVETQELLYPDPSGENCHLYDENIQVQVKNMLNIAIPANKVVVHAKFNGTEITQTVTEAFEPEEVKVVEFTTPFDFSAPTANITWNYVIYTTMNEEEVVYTGNDTITGSFISRRTASFPDSIVYIGSYTLPYTILQPEDLQPHTGDVLKYRFYYTEESAWACTNGTWESATSGLAYETSTSAETDPLYDTAVYWMVARTKNATGTSIKCVTKPIKVIVNVFRPQYDFSTDELVSPVSYQCQPSLSPYLKVSVTNQDTTSTSVIPAGTFNLNANFTGPATVNGTSLINDPVASLVKDTITFANGMNLVSPTHNRIYQYLVYTTPVDASMPVYTINDTISGTVYIPALPDAPSAMSYDVPYGGTQTVTPNATSLSYFYFYENENDNHAFAEGTSFTTDPIFAPTTYYYSGRIESDGFSLYDTCGKGNDHTDVFLNLAKPHSYSKALYNKSELGSVEGYIDSIYFQVSTADGNGVPIPMKFWLKDTEDAEIIASGNNTHIDWLSETANATLVFDGELVLDHQGWVGFPVEGSYRYNGEGLLLYAEHNCGDAPCADSYGVYPVPKFSNTNYNKNRVCFLASNNAVTGDTTFSNKKYHVNTRFKMNYTCLSPKASITINTNVPQHDVGVIAITAPVTQNNNYTANEPVTVTIKNFGTQAASNFPVSYQLANNTPVTQTYTGSLAAGATDNMTFTTNCDLTGVYMPTPFKAYTDLTTDTYHANDTTSITLSTEDPCISRPQSKLDGAYISNVSFAALNNNSGNGMYSDFTQTVAPVEVIVGQEYPLSITHAFTEPSTKPVYKRVYIDYNRDGEFDESETEVASTTGHGERIFNTSQSIPAVDSLATTSALIVVPVWADLGLTRMRVICASSNNFTACTPYNAEGETEDYTVLLSAPMPIDLGIPSIQHPVGEVCADENAKIRVTIRNYGTETQTFSADNTVTVTATVTGATSGTYTAVLDNGSLAPNSDTMIVIPNVNLSAVGNYQVSFQLTYAVDQYLTNNSRSSRAVVTSTEVVQLPFTETFVPQGTGAEPEFSSFWEKQEGASNFVWRMAKGTSPSLNSPTGGPGNDHTLAGAVNGDQGGYATVDGVHNITNPNASSAIAQLNQITTLTSGCINMHYNDIFPVELSFYKYFADVNTPAAFPADFDLSIQFGSGEYYETVETLHKADSGQTGGENLWKAHLLVMKPVDEVARLRFKVTNHHGKIDPSIDDINLVSGKPDMAINRVVNPVDKDDTTGCLQVNSVVVPVIELYNNGNSAVQEFDVKFQVGISGDIQLVTEHVVHFMEPGESYTYTSTHEFPVTNLSQNWEVKATVLIDNDKDEWNNTSRSRSCTNLALEDYENEGSVYLGQNEPNPAVTNTRIPYSVPAPGKVTVEVSTALGQVIYTTTQDADQGINYVDLQTANLAAGIYYYTIHYQDVTLTKKMVVEK